MGTEDDIPQHGAGAARVVRAVTWTSVALALFVAVAGPTVYAWLSWSAASSDTALTTRLHGAIVMQALSRAEADWRDDVVGLLDEPLVQQGLPERRLVLDNAGQVVTASAPLDTGPLVTGSVPLHTTAGLVGELQVQRSLRPVLQRTAVVALLGVLFGLIIFITLRELPLRALRRALQALAQEQHRSRQQLEQYANVLFEEAVDGIIVFDADGLIVRVIPVLQECWESMRTV